MIDLIEMLEEGLRAKPPRGDEKYAHASDNICDRQTWYRRNGEPSMPHDFRTLVKFELGHQFERGIGDILEEQVARERYMVRRDVECSLRGVIGHADFVARDSHDGQYPWEIEDEPEREPFLLEIKSTSFLRGKIPDEPASWYVEQAAMYAAALNVERFGILIGCRESGKLAPIFWFSLSDQSAADESLSWREWANDRATEIAAVTSPDTWAPEPAPRTSWACRTCRYAQCEKNQNPARFEPALL